MRYINTDNIPHFVIPRDAFLFENAIYLSDVFLDLFNKRIEDPPFETFSITSYMGDARGYFYKHGGVPENRTVSLSSGDLDLLIPTTICVYRASRSSNEEDLLDGRTGNERNRFSCISKVYFETKNHGTIVYDTTGKTIIFPDGTTKTMEVEHLITAQKAVRVAVSNLTALLYLKAEQKLVTRLLPKQGTSAQRRKAPDRYATEIHLEFTPELRRIISERRETINKGSGGTKSPHMRRGFIKTQRYGPKLSKVKEIFIEAVHVNKDKGPSTPKQTYRLKVTDQNQGLTV